MEDLLDRLVFMAKEMLTPSQRAMAAERLMKCGTKTKQCDVIFAALKSEAKGRDSRKNLR